MTKTLPTYQFLIDWDGDGDYSNAGEDVSDRVLDTPGFTSERGRDQIRALSPPMAGAASFDLDNRSRDYSPDNAASPLYSLLGPGRKVAVKATWQATTYDLFTGTLDDLPQHPERGARSVSAPSLGSLARFRGMNLTTDLYENITTDQAVAAVLDKAGWPAGDRVLSTGKTVFKYWWLDEIDAFDALVQILNTEGPGAALYEDGAGRIVFEHRHYRLTTARSTTAQGVFRDTGAAPWHTNFQYQPGLKDIINSVALNVNTRTLEALGVVWQLGGTLTLPAYATTQIVASGTEPFKAAVTPVAGTDYTVTAGALTSLTLSRTAGPNTTITIVAGSAGVTLAGLQLRAQTLTRNPLRVVNTIDTSASKARYGLRTYTEPIWPEIDLNVAQDFANAIVGAYQEQRALTAITITADDDLMAAHVFQREISDRITVVEGQSGLNSDVFIEYIAHTVTKGGKSHAATFGCEKAVDRQYAVWGTARWGESIFAW